MTVSRIATFAVNGSIKYGVATDRGIVDLWARSGKEFPTLREVIAAGRLRQFAEDAERQLADFPLDTVTWLPPIPAPEWMPESPAEALPALG